MGHCERIQRTVLPGSQQRRTIQGLGELPQLSRPAGVHLSVLHAQYSMALSPASALAHVYA
jgi:hypothetical protein